MDNNSRRSSIISHANSAYSQAGSTRHMLADMSNASSSDYGGLLNPPKPPFAGMRGSRDNLSLQSNSNLSLTVNYLPSKFSSSLGSAGGVRYRKSGKGGDEPNFPKRGGGLEAFRTNESRMPQGKGRLRWNKFKWILFFTNTLLTLYSLAALVVCLLTWFDVWENADVIRAGNRSELVLSTVAACIGIFTSVIGWAGILLNNRGFLAWYTFLTWITFGFLVIPGYLTYKRRTFNLEGKVNAQWSRSLRSEGRLRIQNQLKCCGYFNPFIEATISQTCYARSILPGCKRDYLQFERKILGIWFKAVFGLVPVHLAVMIAGLLCSDHITYRFGKGMMPEAYRLNLSTMAVIMDNYANQLADQYGADVAGQILKRSQYSQSSDQLGDISSAPYGGDQHPAITPFQARYDAVHRGSDNVI
ncbi:tetraspanin Tsp2 family [Crassisporium funariophilum]|nr:tetraspanin Tsp2 family [Crassisporium funariophilum]